MTTKTDLKTLAHEVVDALPDTATWLELLEAMLRASDQDALQKRQLNDCPATPGSLLH